MTSPQLIALVAGEASGDLLGAELIDGLKRQFPQARFVGIGGPRMIAAGLEAWYPAEKLAVMGLFEVLPRLRELLAIRRDLRRRLIAARPDVFIGIDAPDFNLGLERKLKAAGLRTVHYVSPSVWAWREKRAEKLGRSADRVLCLFPMEPPIYARHGVDARFVGHPLARHFELHTERAPARAALGLRDDAPVLCLMPGSRLGEIRRLGPDFIAAALRCREHLPGLQLVAPMANAACRELFESQLIAAGLGDDTVVRVLDGQAHAAMLACDVVLLASGTAALEALLAKRPMVVAYKLSPLTYRMVKLLRLMRTERYSLPNILAGRELVPELMQDACTPDALAAALLDQLRDTSARATQIAEFERIHRSLLPPSDDAPARAIAALLSDASGAAAL